MLFSTIGYSEIHTNMALEVGPKGIDLTINMFHITNNIFAQQEVKKVRIWLFERQINVSSCTCEIYSLAHRASTRDKSRDPRYARTTHARRFKAPTLMKRREK